MMNEDTGPEVQPSPVNARKRKHGINETGPIRPFKHRSSRACQSCRARKVRCDVVKNRTGCTNCKLDGLECIVLASRRGKHNYRDTAIRSPHSSSPPSSQHATRSSELTQEIVAHEGDIEQHASAIANADNIGSYVPVSVTFDQDLDRTGEDPDLPHCSGVDSVPLPSASQNDVLSTPDVCADLLQHYDSPTAIGSLPAFIAPISSQILAEDLEFLAYKGAITMPEPDLRTEIIRSYLFCVHPFMPMLSIRSFISAILELDGHEKVSLLLFQAIMFAGLHGLPLKTIHRLGFESTKSARAALYGRVRLLYEFDVEPDNASVLQSLILMSTWYGKWNDRRHTWHWTGLAYDLARNMGLHREPTGKYASDNTRGFRRRLWWSLYIRDRMIALGTRRPMRILDEDCSVEMLSIEDFDLVTSNDAQEAALMPCKEERNSTALMCIELARLCKLIGQIMSSQYTTLSTQPGIPHTIMIVSRRDEQQLQALDICDAELNEWYQTLNQRMIRSDRSIAKSNPQSCSEVHEAILNLTYWTTMNVLHRAQALHAIAGASQIEASRRSSRSKVKEAARRITKLTQSMLHHDQIRYLGLLGVTALIAAGLSHLLEITSGDEDIRDASTLRLYQTVEVVHALRGIYASADSALLYLTSVAQSSRARLPDRISGSSTGTTSRSNHGVTGPLGQRLPLGGNYNGSKYNMSNMKPHRILSPNECTSDRAHGPSEQLPSHAMDDVSRIAPSSYEVAPSTNPDSFSFEQTQLIGEPQVQSSYSFPDPTAFSWYNDLDGGSGLEPMAFNYDFYSHAFVFPG